MMTPPSLRELGGFLMGADDGIRTRDPHLGKVVLYQLSHVRVGPNPAVPAPGAQAA